MTESIQKHLEPIWNREGFTFAVDTAVGTLNSRHVRDELPWQRSRQPDPLRQKRYAFIHALAWRAADALALPPKLAAAIVRFELEKILRFAAEIKTPDRKHPIILAHLELGDFTGGEPDTSLETFVGRFSELNEWRYRRLDSLSRIFGADKICSKSLIIVDLNAQASVIMYRAAEYIHSKKGKS